MVCLFEITVFSIKKLRQTKREKKYCILVGTLNHRLPFNKATLSLFIPNRLMISCEKIEPQY